MHSYFCDPLSKGQTRKRGRKRKKRQGKKLSDINKYLYIRLFRQAEYEDDNKIDDLNERK